MNTSDKSRERSFVLNAFRPGTAIDTPRRFAGRKQHIAALSDAIQTHGTCPVIFGERGLGKTSVAMQIDRIARGDIELLQDLDLSQHAIPEGQRYATFYLACTDDIRSKNELLHRIINLSAGHIDDFSGLRLESESKKNKVDLKVFQSEVVSSYTARHRLQEYINLSVEEQLLVCLNWVADKLQRPVLVILDEFDRVRSHHGLASLIKSASSETLKFMLVGVAHDVSSLLMEHQSLERLLVPVSIERMSDAELEKIIVLVVRTLRDHQLAVGFDSDAAKSLVKAAQGLPWFIHILGQDALIAAYDARESTITSADIQSVINHIATSRYARQFQDQYLNVVGDSFHREIVLRAFARWPSRDIPTSEIYPIAHALGVSNPSQCVKELMTVRCGRTLAKAPFRAKGTYAFTNIMFKRYVNLRRAVYSRLDERIDAAWEAHFGTR